MDSHGYRILSRLASNDHSDTFTVEHPELGRPAALKLWRGLPPPDQLDREAHASRARAVMALDHALIAKVHDFGYMLEFLPYVTSELAAGQWLLGMHGAAPRLCVDVFIALSDAIAAVHAADLVHGSLRPTKILIGAGDAGGGPYRAATGLKLLGLLGPPRPTHGWLGDFRKPREIDLPYLAPEQIRNGSADARSDVYALGAMLYQAVCGAAPVPILPDEHVMEYLSRRVRDRPDPDWRNVPLALKPLVARALHAVPARRHANAAELRDELLAVKV